MKSIFRVVLISLFALPVLSGCGEEHVHQYVEKITKQPTCTEPGEGYLYCEEDGAYTKSKEIPPLGHNEAVQKVAATCLEQGYDYHYCTRCGVELSIDNYVEPHGHHFVSGNVAPTCTASGHVESYCEYCGLEEFEPYDLEPTGHDFEVINTVASTCTTKGFDEVRCRNCGVERRMNYVDALGHDVSLTSHIDSTCLEFGKLVYTCSRCQYRHEELDPTVLPLGHDYILHEAEDPDCDHDGHHAYHTCSRCDFTDFTEETIIPALGHKYDKVITPATCLTDGYTTYTCSVCGETHKGDYVTAPGHDLVHHEEKHATCTESGYKAYDTCKNCDYSTYEETPALGLEHEYVEQTVEPTTSSKGYIIHQCIHCDDHYLTDFTDTIPAFRSMSSDSGLVLDETLTDAFSWRNDDYYYFILYHGRVEDYPLHTFLFFTWNEEMAYMESYPKTIQKALAMDVLDTHIKSQNTLYEQVDETLNRAGLLDIDETHGIKKATASSFDTEFIDKWPTTLTKPLEMEDSSLTSLTTKINSITSSYKPGQNLEQYENDLTYVYAAVANIDMYIGVCYDLAQKAITYKPYTVLSSDSLSEKLFCTKEDIYSSTPVDVTERASKLLVKPTSYNTNHPIKEIYFSECMTNGDGNLNIKSGKVLERTYHDDRIAEYVNMGYDRAFFRITWYYNTSWWASDHSILFQIGYNKYQYIERFDSSSDYVKSITDNYESTWRKYDKGGSAKTSSPTGNIYFYMSDVYFGSASEIILRWKNDATLDRGPYNIQIWMQMFNESAFYEGTYGDNFRSYNNSNSGVYSFVNN